MRYYLGQHVFDRDIGCLMPPAGSMGAIHLVEGVSPCWIYAMPDAAPLLPSEYRLFGRGDMNVKPQDRAIFASMIGVANVSGTTLSDWLWDVQLNRSDPTGAGPWTSSLRQDGTLATWLGGEGSFRMFDINAPEANNIIERVKIDYRNIRQLALDGKLGRFDRDQGRFIPDADFHRRYLTVLAEQFKVNNPEDVFIPADLPRETALPHNTTWTETFPGTSATLGGDQVWTVTNGTWANVSGTGQCATGATNGDARCETTLSSTNHSCQVDVTTGSTGNSGQLSGATTRNDAAARSYYIGLQQASLSQIYLQKVTAGTRAGIAGPGSSGSAAGTVYIESNGNQHTVKWNGVTQVGPTTDNSFSGQLLCGLWANTPSVVAEVFDNCTATDLAGGATRPVKMAGEWGGYAGAGGGFAG